MGNKQSYKDLVENVKIMANKELEYCDPNNTPYMCKMISTNQGKKQVISQILDYCGKQGLTISQAITKVEQLLNPNSLS